LIPKWFRAGDTKLDVPPYSINHIDRLYMEEVVNTMLRKKGVDPTRLYFDITVYYREDK
jgi:hypothetical protein